MVWLGVSALCFLLYGYSVHAMGRIARGLLRDLLTVLLGLFCLLLAGLLGLPCLGWVLTAALFLVYTFFYDQELFPLQWGWTLLPGLLLSVLTAAAQIAAGIGFHGLFPLMLCQFPMPWAVTLALGLCLELHLQLAWKRQQLSWVTGLLAAGMELALILTAHVLPAQSPLCLGLGLALFAVLEYALRHYQAGYERNTRDFQTTVLTHQYEEIKTIYLNMRGWRHDYHNHLQVLKAHFALGQMDELGRYLDKLEQDLGRVDSYIKSGNLMIDAILNSKLSLAQQKETTLHFKAELPEQLPVRDVDLCVILGNLLDNAIEACEQIPAQDRFLRVYCAILKNQLYLSVQNAAKEDLTFDERNYITQKRGNHGLGMKRVKVLVDQYQGFLNLQNQPGIFAAEVLIPLHT